MVSAWAKADRINSAVIDRIHGVPIVWRPKSHSTGSRLTTGTTSNRRDDPDRPARGVDQADDPFVGVVVWRPTTIDPGTAINDQGGIASADLMLEFDIERFRRADGEIELPRKYDLFEIPTEDGQILEVEMPREAVDDGTSRVQCFCNAPE